MQARSLSRRLVLRATRSGQTARFMVPLLVNNHHDTHQQQHNRHHHVTNHHNNCRRHLSYAPMAPPPLFDLCVRKSFDAALRRAQTHPHEAAFRHPRNWTALHCCVEHVAPLEVVKAIYLAHPSNVTATDWQGYTPAEAAVDLATKEYLQQEADIFVAKSGGDGDESATSAMETNSSSTNTDTTTLNNSSDAMLLGKVISHTNNLSSKVLELSATTENLRKELEDLKQTLRAMSNK